MLDRRLLPPIDFTWPNTGRGCALQACLNCYGIVRFVAHNDIEPVLEWQNEIENGIGDLQCHGRFDAGGVSRK